MLFFRRNFCVGLRLVAENLNFWNKKWRNEMRKKIRPKKIEFSERLCSRSARKHCPWRQIDRLMSFSIITKIFSSRVPKKCSRPKIIAHAKERNIVFSTLIVFSPSPTSILTSKGNRVLSSHQNRNLRAESLLNILCINCSNGFHVVWQFSQNRSTLGFFESHNALCTSFTTHNVVFIKGRKTNSP